MLLPKNIFKSIYLSICLLVFLFFKVVELLRHTLYVIHTTDFVPRRNVSLCEFRRDGEGVDKDGGYQDRFRIRFNRRAIVQGLARGSSAAFKGQRSPCQSAELISYRFPCRMSFRSSLQSSLSVTIATRENPLYPRNKLSEPD